MNARDLAHEILSDVITHHDYANLSLKKRLQEVDSVDQALCTALVYTTLQHHRTVRSLWTQYVSKFPKSSVAVLLDLACAQLRYFDRLPDYAIVDEAVKWTNKNAPYASSMVNAVLRKVQKDPRQHLQGEDAVDTFALNHALDTWIYRLWSAHYGTEKAQEIAKALLKPAHITARINTLKIDKEQLLKDEHIQACELSQNCVVSDDNLVHSSYIKKGQLFIQDESSAYVAEFAQAQKGMKVLDVCSAPGSKTAGLAISMENEGDITAIELHPTRAKLVDELMEHLGIDIVHTKTFDARYLDQELMEKEYDLILADVPCTGLGVLRRKADIKLRLSPNQLDEIEGLQRAILEGVHKLCKVNGTLIYSTCTLNKKENEYQIKHFLSKNPEYELIEERTIFPQDYNSDGFYMAKLKRVS